MPQSAWRRADAMAAQHRPVSGIMAGLIAAYVVMIAVPAAGIALLIAGRQYPGVLCLALVPSLAALHLTLLIATRSVPAGGMAALPILLGGVGLTQFPRVMLWVDMGDFAATAIVCLVSLGLIGAALFLGIAVEDIRADLRLLFSSPRALFRFPRIRAGRQRPGSSSDVQ